MKTAYDNGLRDILPPNTPTFTRSPMFKRPASIHKLFDKHHFHYPSVELGPIDVELADVDETASEKDPTFVLEIRSNGTMWKIRRTLTEMCDLDRQLHRCVYERRYSKLEELDSEDPNCALLINDYCTRLSQLTGSIITCYPVLNFLEVDSKGNHFCPAEKSAINTPAVAAAIVTKNFAGKGPEQLTIKIGDILSIIEMSPTQSRSTWWKAKLTIRAQRDSPDKNNEEAQAFQIGYFPSDCVALFDEKAIQMQSPLISRRLPLAAAKRMSQLLRKRLRSSDKVPVFGTDLVVHLRLTGQKVPLILQRCVAAIEQHGIVTGIYRQCGILSNIMRLRGKFDCGRDPNLSDFQIVRDIYAVSSLIKQYFRVLPTPLFTFDYYHDLLKVIEERDETKRKENLKEILKKFPKEHYRTAGFLMRHLAHLCDQEDLTDMSSKNLAIVWAPNLFRSRPTMPNQENDHHMLVGLNHHTTLTNFIIENARELFPDEEETENVDESRIVFDLGDDHSTHRHSRHEQDAEVERTNKSRWSRFLRGSSVEHLIGGRFSRFSRKSNPPSSNSLNSTPVSTVPNPPISEAEETVNWRRSNSTSQLRQSRSASLLSMVADGFRSGVRTIRHRAQSLRPSNRRSIETQSTSQGHLPQTMQRSVTLSTTSRFTEVTYPTNSPFQERRISFRLGRHRNVGDVAESLTEEDSSDVTAEATTEEKEVVELADPIEVAKVLQIPCINEPEEEPEVTTDSKESEPVEKQEEEVSVIDPRPLADRSSPVEEWSSDSSRASSMHLDMSRYDNVTPTGDYRFLMQVIISFVLAYFVIC